MLAALRDEKHRWLVFPIALFVITRSLLLGGAYLAYSANGDVIL
jgi:hypothetical protein